MTTRAGHIASLIIAAFFATLLVAAWFPAAPDGEQHRRLFAFGDITQIYKKEIAQRQEIARTTDAAPRLSAPATANEKSVEPNHKEIKKNGESDMSGWDMFFDVRLTDILLVVFMGMVWWNSRNIWKAMQDSAVRERETSDEAVSLLRASAAMEALAKTVIAATATDALTPAAPVVKTRRRRMKKNAAVERED